MIHSFNSCIDPCFTAPSAALGWWTCSAQHTPLLVERKLGVRLLHVGLVALLKVLGQDDIPAHAHMLCT